MVDLWLRSKDGRELKKVRKGIHIEPVGFFSPSTGEVNDSHTFTVMVDGYPIDAYETQERAQEVLDEIQEFLTQPIILSGLVRTNVVFQMPEN